MENICYLYVYFENKFFNILNNVFVEFDSFDCIFGNIGYFSF